MPRHDAMEGEPARFQLSKRDAQLLQRASVKMVNATATVNEHAGEPAHVRIEAYNRVQDQTYSPGLRISCGWSSRPQAMAASDQCMN
jgi:hypothetical protein